MSLNRRQLALVHVARAKTGMSEDVYRSLLASRWGVTTSKDLTRAQLDELLKVFRSMGFRVKHTVLNHPNPLALPSPAQLALIERLWATIGWTDSARRRGFCIRLFRNPWPQSRQESNALIAALKDFKKRGYTDRPKEGA